MKEYKAIIFDLGNVVFHCSSQPIFEHWANISNWNIEELKVHLDLEDENHKEFEKSKISSDQFRQYISRQLNNDLTDQEFEKGWNAIYGDIIDGVDNLLLDLQKHYRIVALTNTNVTHAKVWRVKYKSILSIFEKVFASDEIEARKPEQSAYQICLDYLDVSSDQVIFLDDRIDNIEGARKLGMDTILVSSFDQMIMDLEKKGIKLLPTTSKMN